MVYSAYPFASLIPSLLKSFFFMLKLSYAKAIQELCFENALTSCLALWYCGLTVLFAFILQYACLDTITFLKEKDSKL